MRVRQTLIAVAALALVPAMAAAQPYAGSTAPRAGSLEVGGGVVWTGGYDAGSASASETTAGTAPLTLFVVDGTVKSGPGAVVQIGIHLGRRFSAEGALHYTRPVLQARQSADFESATAATAETVITSYLIGGSLLYHFADGRVVPFVSGGGGYLRQLYEDNADVLTGTELHAGGGLKVWLGSGPRRLGLRLEAQASARGKSVAFEQRRRLVPAVAAGITYRF